MRLGSPHAMLPRVAHTEPLLTLRERLTRCYDSSALALKAAADAGIDPTRINFDAPVEIIYPDRK